MSMIIGYVADGKVYMATDTGKSIDNYHFSDATETGMNVFYLPHGVICGATVIPVKQAIQINPQWFDGLSSEPLTKKFIVNEIVPRLYETVKELDLMDVEEGEEPDWEGVALLAQNDKLFCIDAAFCVHRITKFCAAGAGPEFTVPRLLSHKDEPVRDMLYDALSDSKAYLCNVREPYYLFSTDTDEKQLLRRS